MKTTLVTAALLALLPGCIYVDAHGADWAWDESDAHWSELSRQGSGVRASETRALEPFRAVEVSRAGIDVEVRVGTPAGLEVTGDDNLLEHVDTQVRGSVLEISMDEGRYRFREPMRVVVTAPELDSLRVRSAADVRVFGLDAERFELRVEGSGDVQVQGRADRLEVVLRGSGDLELFDLIAREARVEIEGSGDVDVHATERLWVRVSGSGDVEYRGDAQVMEEIDGSGDVERSGG